MNSLEIIFHYGSHFIFSPLLVAYIGKKFWKKNFERVYLITLATMLVDLDHLLANPIFDPNRCSIAFHPLHSHYAIAFYILMLFFKKTRIVGLGLVFHMLTDFFDCFYFIH